LLVEVLQAGEGAAGKEVRFHAPEAALVAGFPVRVIDRVTDEAEAVALREGFHLRHDDRAAPRAAQPSQVRVVDDAAAEVQAAADLPQRHPLLMQLVNGIPHVRFDHKTPPSS